MDLQELYTIHPEIEQIVDRLKLGERKAQERKSFIKRGNTETSNYLPKKNTRLICEHGVVASWIANGKTIANPGLLLRGKDFEESLEKIIEKNPSKIKIMIYAGSTTDSQVKLRQDFILKEDDSNSTALPEPKVIESSKEVTTNQLSGVEQGLLRMEQRLDEMQKRPVPESLQNSDPITKLHYEMTNRQIEFDKQLADLKHAAAIDKLNAEHQKEITRLEAEIADLEEEIEDLIQDLTDSENALSGLEKEVSKPKEESFTLQTFLNLSERVLAGVLKNHVNPKVAKELMGMSDEQFENLWIKEGENKAIEKGADNTGFTAAAETDYFEGLDAKFAESLKFFLQYFKNIGFDNFKIIGTLIAQTMNEDGSLDVEKTKTLLQLTKEEETK